MPAASDLIRPMVTGHPNGVDLPHHDWPRIEMAVGVLMQLGGWDAPMARSRLTRSADRSDVPVATLAAAILGLFPGSGR